ncbi:uncharacterized protein LOC124198125 [Daphnia pulex]|uniref:uncharacterized protein LOC124198125 n=1 Tax=Daphnia pulex TaxID=6669 RepID=UPI001EDD4399|nr:uncharacterized protein LOC124198125 [Daphnia pulex]XP_046449765.1 uncharacterized protein LOC124198125 [Daphnia pulex]
MVLTEQELVLAITKSQRDRRIRSALFTRRNTVNFSEQAACDREIQRYLCLKGTLAYRFNCCIVHQPWRFNQISALNDHGWDELGPTNETLHSIYRTLPFYQESIASTTNFRVGEINNLNKKTSSVGKDSKANKNLVIDYDSDRKVDMPSWGARLLSCIFA